jgi:hypothetical protein
MSKIINIELINYDLSLLNQLLNFSKKIMKKF